MALIVFYWLHKNKFPTQEQQLLDRIMFINV